ncbi:MFS transporter [Pantoea sp. paga]|nr:MFS transporter [Pantoea sp. paga]TSH78293.1 MFS transporter [Pantoea sp. paga]
MLAFSLLSWSFTVYFYLSRAIISDVIAANKWKATFSNIQVIFNLAFVVGPILGGMVDDNGTLHAFIMMSILLLNIVAHNAITPSLESKKNRGGYKISEFIYPLKDLSLSIFLIGTIFVAISFMQLDLLLPITIQERIKVNDLNFLNFHVTPLLIYTLCLATNGLLTITFAKSFSRLSEKYTMKFAFVTSGLFYGVSMLIFAVASRPSGFFLGIFILTIGELLVVSLHDTYVATISPEGMRSSYFSIASSRFALSRVVAPQMIMIAASIGKTSTFILIGIIAMCSSLIFSYLFSIPIKNKEW